MKKLSFFRQSIGIILFVLVSGLLFRYGDQQGLNELNPEYIKLYQS